jgi:hypothetical protein
MCPGNRHFLPTVVYNQQQKLPHLPPYLRPSAN